jgi:transcriptional regulator with XRE-family HTH domain
VPNDHTKKVAKIFKKARLKQDLTQIELAELAGLSASSYGKIERTESKPSTESLRKLAKALKIDSSEVL